MKKILLFDEEILLSNEIQEGFQLKDPDIHFDCVSTYSKALDKVISDNYDIILIDVVIPFTKEDRNRNSKLSNNQNTGIIFKNHLLELIENNEVKSKPKIYFFTARTNLTNQDKQGIDNIILKPQRPSQIYSKVIS
ncbi:MULTISPECIES: hypothetical protein [Flavobacteriaceae]|uniref:hypothetical protein n=1 Tax=Flavobacteriaceae TaxID=49546 RepID=UPI0014912E9E|nr:MULTISPECIES: hypothetical protein [Allomuricauda]MDC6364685.1 hypothetical protein [Muricauda sp. AC10]